MSWHFTYAKMNDGTSSMILLVVEDGDKDGHICANMPAYQLDSFVITPTYFGVVDINLHGPYQGMPKWMDRVWYSCTQLVLYVHYLHTKWAFL